jgi:hypothetical protein
MPFPAQEVGAAVGRGFLESGDPLFGERSGFC